MSPTRVIEAEATPGVDENMSTAKPMAKHHRSAASERKRKVHIQQWGGIAEQVDVVEHQRLYDKQYDEEYEISYCVKIHFLYEGDYVMFIGGP